MARIPARIPMTSIALCAARLFNANKSAGILAIRSAIASTAPSSSSAGCARLAKPLVTASTPLIESPVSSASIPRRKPIIQVCHCISGGDIKRTGGYPILASSATYTRSHAVASSVPPAKQYPCTCPMIGVLISHISNQLLTTCRDHQPSAREIARSTSLFGDPKS